MIWSSKKRNGFREEAPAFVGAFFVVLRNACFSCAEKYPVQGLTFACCFRRNDVARWVD